MIVISDVHGCFDTLKRLIDKLPQNEDICFVGDLIDRGPKSAQVVQFVIDNEFDCVMGNHEELMMCAVKWADFGSTEIWHRNGGMKTELSYGGDFELEKEHIQWMENLPIIKKYENIGLVVSHSSCANYLLNGEDIEYRDDVLWGRNFYPKKTSLFNVFGHSIVEKPVMKEWWAAIDTGCFANRKLTALQYPQMKIYQQKNVEGK